MKNKKEKDANGNIILEEGYYMNDNSVMVGSVKKERKYDDQNRILMEKTYFWDQEAKNWKNMFEENHEYTDTSTTEKHYKWENGACIPSYMKTEINDKEAKYKETIKWNWDTILNEWTKTMGNKSYYLNDSLAVEEAYSRNYDINEYIGTRREIRLKGKHAQGHSMLIKDKWDREEKKWYHNIRSTSWNLRSKPEYNMIELYDRELEKWIPDKKVESFDEDNETLYIWKDNKWLRHKRSRKEISSENEERINLYIWDQQSGKWQEYMSRTDDTLENETIYVYYLWNKETASWVLTQRSHEFNISVGQQYNHETKEWEYLNRDTMIRFDEKFSFDISGWNDIDIFLHPLMYDF